MPPNVDRVRRIRRRAAAGREVAISYNDTDATALQGGTSKDAAFQIEGYRERYRFSIWIDSDAFSTTPRETTRMTVAGEERMILGVFPDSIGAMIRIDLGERYGRA